MASILWLYPHYTSNMCSALFVQKVWTLWTRALHDPHAKGPKVADRWWMEVETYPSHFKFPPQIKRANVRRFILARVNRFWGTGSFGKHLFLPFIHSVNSSLLVAMFWGCKNFWQTLWAPHHLTWSTQTSSYSLSSSASGWKKDSTNGVQKNIKYESFPRNLLRIDV